MSEKDISGIEFPKLRQVEAFPVAVSGKTMIGLRDPLNLTSDIIAIPQQLHLMLVLMDGKHSIVDMQAEYMRAAGQLIYKENIEELLEKLDKGLFLDNDNFRQKRDAIESDFRNAPVRPAILAGKSYDDSPEHLTAQIEGFFTDPEGPGPINKDKASDRLKGIIAPHIDFQRGGPCFAWAYKEVAEQTDADLFVIFGTAHNVTNETFVLTYKDFEAPYGALKCDRKIVEQIQKKVSYDLFQDELVHRNEHSIEFQTIFLSYLFQNEREISILPILCGSFHEMVFTEGLPIENEKVGQFISALKEVLVGSGRKICFIAGADLAHVGPRFGDREPVGEAHLQLLEGDDRRTLQSVELMDSEGFFLDIQSDGDRRKICGLPPIYMMLEVMDADKGELLKYQQWPDPNGTVTFASVAFY